MSCGSRWSYRLSGRTLRGAVDRWRCEWNVGRQGWRHCWHRQSRAASASSCPSIRGSHLSSCFGGWWLQSGEAVGNRSSRIRCAAIDLLWLKVLAFPHLTIIDVSFRRVSSQHTHSGAITAALIVRSHLSLRTSISSLFLLENSHCSQFCVSFHAKTLHIFSLFWHEWWWLGNVFSLRCSRQAFRGLRRARCECESSTNRRKETRNYWIVERKHPLGTMTMEKLNKRSPKIN